jgi:hypothetical protein
MKRLQSFIGMVVMLQLSFSCIAAAADEIPHFRNMPHANYDETGRKLPPGIPREVDTNGVVVYINHHFTTPAYQKEALKRIIQEANEVANDLNLPEELPITNSNLVEFHVSPFGFAYAYKAIGSVTTKHFSYYVSRDNKFSQLNIADYDQTCLRLVNQGTFPVERINTNEAFRLATNWLTRASIDVAKLNKECLPHVAVSPYWSGLSNLGDKPKKSFIPIYYVWWTYPDDAIKGEGSAAEVELFAPTETILQLGVEDPKYNLRQQIVFTNMATLFPGIALVHTNYPVKTILINQPLWK